LLDGTLANYGHALDNINIALKKNRDVFIFYIYQDPIVAWSFVKKREALEGRRVNKQIFISEFFAAKDNVSKLKNEFGNRIIVHLLKKDYNNQVKRIEMNISNIDSYVKFDYNKNSLEAILE